MLYTCAHTYIHTYMAWTEINFLQVPWTGLTSKFCCNHKSSGTKGYPSFAYYLHKVVIHQLHCQVQGLMTHLKGHLEEYKQGRNLNVVQLQKPYPDGSNYTDAVTKVVNYHRPLIMKLL